MTYRRVILGLVATAAIMAFAGLSGHAAAKHPDTTFKQLILPIDCQFQIVDTGLGTVVYLTPATCGQVPHVPSGGSSNGNHGGNSHGSSGGNHGTKGNPGHHKVNDEDSFGIPAYVAGPTSSGHGQTALHPPIAIGHTPKLIKLNTKPQALKDSGYRTSLSLGSNISYFPLGDNSNTQHSLTVTNITPDGITVLLQPSGQFIKITYGHTVYLDFDNAGHPALAIRLVSRPANGQAVLGIQLVKSVSSSDHPTEKLSPSVQVLVAVLVAFSLISLSNIFWKSRLDRRSGQ